MKRYITTIILVAGFCLWIPAMMVIAQDEPDTPDPPEYIGTRDCNDCHRDIARSHALTPHAQTMVELEEEIDPEDNPIVADFSTGAVVRSVTFPGEDESRSFDLPDVAYTLGAGRNKQAFIYRTSDDVYYVLPAEWDVASASWEPLELDESWPADGYNFGQNCAGCHTVGLNSTDYEWEEEAVMCEACHGPGLAHVEAADDAGRSIDEEEFADIRNKISLALDGQTCGQCHVRGLASDGIHPYPTEYLPGQSDLSDGYDLVDSSDDTYWWSTGHARLPNMQYNEWLNSTHPNALASAQESEAFGPNCLTCHSSTQLLIDLRLNNEEVDPESVDPLALAEEHPYGITCASCHDPHLVVDGEEMPPEPSLVRENSYFICVDCHQGSDITEGVHHPVREVFEGRPIIEGIAVQASPHFTQDGPICTTCHMATVPTYNGDRQSHTFDIIEPGEAIGNDSLQGACTACHNESPETLQHLIDDLQVGTKTRIENSRAALSDDTAEWVFTALDIVENEGSFGIHNYKYTVDLLKSVELELGLISTSLSEADVVQQIDSTLPEVDRSALEPTDEPLVELGGLTTPSILLLLFAAGILVYSALAFFRSN